MRIRRVLSLCTAALALTPASASAVDICVKRDGCAPARTHADLAAALADAKAQPGRDRILLGAGEHAGTANQAIDSDVELAGAGRGQSILTGASGPSAAVLSSSLAGVSVHDLSVRVPRDTAVGLRLLGNGSEIARVEVTLADAGDGEAIAFELGGDASRLADSIALLPVRTGTTGAAVQSAAASGEPARVSGVELAGGVGFLSNNATQLSASRVSGTRPVVLNGGTARLDDVVARTVAGAAGESAGILAAQGGEGRLVGRHLTLVNDIPDVGNAVRIGYTGDCIAGTGSTTVELRDSVAVRYPWRLFRQGCADDTTGPCAAPAPRSANAIFDRVHFDGAAVAGGGGCFSDLNSSFGDARLVSFADPRPRAGSPLIDSGTPGPLTPGEPESDAMGRLRLVDGDGNGSLARDRGAYEYQRLAPVLTASVSPATNATGAIFGFRASATDPDGETVSYGWSFDDGTGTIGPNVDKTFDQPGPHSGTVVVTDGSGLSSSQTLSVEVQSPAPVTPRDTKAPRLRVGASALRPDARGRVRMRVFCSEAAKAVLTIRTERRVRVTPTAERALLRLGRRAFTCRANRTTTVVVQLSTAARRFLEREGSAPVVGIAAARDAAGNRGTARRTVVARRAAR